MLKQLIHTASQIKPVKIEEGFATGFTKQVEEYNSTLAGIKAGIDQANADAESLFTSVLSGEADLQLRQTLQNEILGLMVRLRDVLASRAGFNAQIADARRTVAADAHTLKAECEKKLRQKLEPMAPRVEAEKWIRTALKANADFALLDSTWDRLVRVSRTDALPEGDDATIERMEDILRDAVAL